MLLTLSRQVLILLPAILVLGFFFQVNGHPGGGAHRRCLLHHPDGHLAGPGAPEPARTARGEQLIKRSTTKTPRLQEAVYSHSALYLPSNPAQRGCLEVDLFSVPHPHRPQEDRQDRVVVVGHPGHHEGGIAPLASHLNHGMPFPDLDLGAVVGGKMAMPAPISMARNRDSRSLKRWAILGLKPARAQVSTKLAWGGRIDREIELQEALPGQITVGQALPLGQGMILGKDHHQRHGEEEPVVDFRTVRHGELKHECDIHAALLERLGHGHHVQALQLHGDLGVLPPEAPQERGEEALLGDAVETQDQAPGLTAGQALDLSDQLAVSLQKPLEPLVEALPGGGWVNRTRWGSRSKSFTPTSFSSDEIW